MKTFSLPFLFILLHFSIVAQTQTDTISDKEVPQVVIIAQKDRLLTGVPGSAAYITPLQLKRLAPISGNEVFRKIPGINMVEEEGAGLRANIGIRGLDPDRSASVLMLEDGIPIQLNPYGEPELYYTPAIDRMEAIEVVKGSGQILFGPRTIGGVINYITPDAPATPTTKIRVSGGSGGYLSTLVSHGRRFGNVGFQADYLHKRADRLGVTSFKIHDLNLKSQMVLSEKSSLVLKTQFYTEQTDATYVGITQPMFEQGNYYPIMTPDDLLKVRRIALSAQHKWQLQKNTRLHTSAYAYTIDRDWRRQNFSYDRTSSNISGVIFGDTTVANGAIYLLNTAASRNRIFLVRGAESRLTHQYALFGHAQTVDLGARLVAESAIEQQINSNSPVSVSGQLVTDEYRPGWAVSAFAQQKMEINSKIQLTAGIRLEDYHFDRRINLVRLASGAYRDTLISAQSRVTSLIPGIGIAYQAHPNWNLFGGLHKGFAPPAIKNSVSATGEVFQLDAQTSWNAEIGTRATPYKGVSFEFTGFYMDFDKQVIAVSESSGGTGSGFLNGGRTKHLGIETGLHIDFGQLAGSSHSIYLDANATVVSATFSADRFIGTDRINIEGFDLPYAPRLMVNQTIGWLNPGQFQMQLTGSYTGKQFTDVLNTVAPSANGRSGQIPSTYLIDAMCSYPVKKWNSNFSLAVKNITDERFIVSRRPQGIRVNLPRTFVASWQLVIGKRH